MEIFASDSKSNRRRTRKREGASLQEVEVEEEKGGVKRGRISAQGSDDRKFAHRDRERVTAAAVIQKESPVRDEMSLSEKSSRH
jgi:hypothetical protein